jgi:hypothetical protein
MLKPAPRIGDDGRITDSFGGKGEFLAWLKSDEIAVQRKIYDLTAPISQVFARAHCAGDDLINVPCAIALAENGLIAP